MKKPIFICNLIFLLSLANCFAQSKKTMPSSKEKANVVSQIINPNKFIGIGIFKIGVDTSVIYSYAQSQSQAVTSIDDDEVYFELYQKNTENETLDYQSEKGIYKLVRNESMNLSAAGLSYCPTAVDYFISEYSVSGVNLYNLRLTFFQNKLVEVKCNSSQSIIDAMKVKYGNPKLSKDIKVVNCVYNLTGIREKKTATTFFEEWLNGPIEAINLTGEYYNDKCELQRTSGFSYEIKDKAYETCWRSHLMDDLKPKGTKDQLKDF